MKEMQRHILKSIAFSNQVILKRCKVRNLPTKYDEYETPFMKSPKPGRSWTTDVLIFLHRKQFSLAMYKNWRKWKDFDEIVDDQKFIPERHQALGPDLATSHFILARGGRIKFKGSDKWMTREHLEHDNLPYSFNPNYCVEELDFSRSNLCYEGFENLNHLKGLKRMVLRNCKYIDDWCLSRCHLFATTLEYLDLSGCSLITERGICSLHVLRKLKTLVLQDTPNIQNKELVCLLLQDVIPKCNIIGVDYTNPVLLERLENAMKSN